MKSYIGVKVVEAVDMTLGEYNKLKGWVIPIDEDPERLGYLVCYPDGYKSWSPKEQFESANFEMGDDSSTVSVDMVKRFRGKIYGDKIDEKTAHFYVKSASGFVVHELSSCVDPKNFSMDVGLECCESKIDDVFWKCLGFVLQWGRFGLNRR